ncbi:MAG: hypothetical protein VW268_05650 [Rhodospirillaceae bacterium]
MHALLKTLVIGMGVLIMLSLGLLVFGFYKTTQDPNWKLFSTSDAPAKAAMPTGRPTPPIALSGDLALGLPTGCEVTGVNSAGGMLYVLTGPRSAARCGHVLIVDPALGRVTGKLAP